MKHLKIWQKLVLMGAVFMLPFAVVARKQYSYINSTGVEFAEQEIRGLEYYAPLSTLVKHLQRHRDLAGAVAAGDQSYQEQVVRLTAEIDQQIKAVDEVNQALDSSLHVGQRWSKLRSSARELIAASPGLSPDEIFKQHTAAIEETLGLISALADASKLSLDSDVDSYYLANFLMLKGPELTEALSQGRAAELASGGRATADQLDALNKAATLAPFLQRRLDKSLAKAFTYNDAVKARLEVDTHASSEAVRKAAADIPRLATPNRTTQAAHDLQASLTSGIDSIFAAEARATETVKGLLNARIDGFHSQMASTLLWTALGVLGVCLLGLLLMRDLTVTMGQVVSVANRISLGDLNVEISGTTRRDEIGGLTRSFDKLVKAKREMVGIAERIAGGDLGVKVQPRLEQDTLGLALANMVERLSTLVGEVQRSGIRVNTSVNEIAATSRQQEATAREIAATTTEIGATSREIAATSRDLARTMNEVSAVADESAGLAGRGQVGLTRMEETMRHVMEAAASINAKLAILNQKAGNINQVVTTITKVADQTNLLSLNAAIEAEKAGEYGRGFAVVATEIRRLADQTAVATYDIDQMVKEIHSAVSAGVMGMDKFSEEVRSGVHEIHDVSEQLSQIIGHVQALAPRFDAVAEGVQAQATGAEQITQSLAQLGDAAQQTVDSLAQSNEVIDGLNQAATGMRTGVSRFKLVA